MKKILAFVMMFGLLMGMVAPIQASAATNIEFNKTATASSSEDSTKTPDMAIDGNASTRWSSSYSDPQWISIDFGSAINVNGVMLNWEAAYAKSYQIQLSTDNSNWTTVFSTTTGDGGVDTISFATQSARYVRMYGTQGQPNTGIPCGILKCIRIADRWIMELFLVRCISLQRNIAAKTWMWQEALLQTELMCSSGRIMETPNKSGK